MPRDRTPEELKQQSEQKPSHGGRYRSADQQVPVVPPSTYDPREQERKLAAEAHATSWKAVYNNAVNAGHWIFDKGTKEWYSPEEFKRQFERYLVGFEQFFKRMEIRDPMEGVKAGYERLRELHNKHEDLVKRVVEHLKDTR